MKKIFSLAVLGVFGLGIALGTAPKTQTVHADGGTTTDVINVIDVFKNVWNNDLNDIETDAYLYGARHGNINHKATVAKYETKGATEGTMSSASTNIDAGGERWYSWLDDRVLIRVEARVETKVTFAAQNPSGGWNEASQIRYYKTANAEGSIGYLAPEVNLTCETQYWAAANFAYETTLMPGESAYLEFGFQWGENQGSGRSLFLNEATPTNLTMTLDYVEPEEPVARVQSINAETIYNHSNDFVPGTLANTAAWAGNALTQTKVDPVSGSEWWDIQLTKDVGFYYAFQANERITLSLENVVVGGWIVYGVDVSYLVARGNEVRTLYTSRLVAGNAASMTPNTLIEAVPGDVIYVYFTTAADAQNIQINTTTFVLTEVLYETENAKNFVNNFVAFRKANPDFCVLDNEKQATLASFIETYDTLGEADRILVDRTHDNGEFTIADTISYFKTSNAGLNNLMISNNNLMLIVIITSALIVSASLVLIKNKRRSLSK